MATVTYVINCSALGDAVCCIPATKALIAENKLYKVLVPEKFCEVFEVCDVDPGFIVPTLRDVDITFDLNGSTLVTAYEPRRAPYRIHLVDMFSVFCMNAILKPEEKCVKANIKKLPPVTLAKPYAVVGVGYAEESRKMPIKAFREIVAYGKKAGIAIVLLGAHRRPDSKNPIKFGDYPKGDCIDLIGQTSLKESISIMNEATCVFGVDSGLIYLASLTETPIICGYTFVDPHYRMPYRHGVMGWKFYPIEPMSSCKYCSNALAMFGVPFDNHCPYGKDYECSKSLDGKDFVRAAKRVLCARSKP